MLRYAPIALFVYNRLWHTQQTVQSLQENPLANESELTIFSDGPKDVDGDAGVQDVREWIKTITGFKKISIIEQPENKGLAKSIIDGVTAILEHEDRVIVMEDDLVVSKHFLHYMNEGLRIYEEEPAVASIHGYALPLKEAMPETYFMRGADCWGWATWRRAWKYFEPDGNKLLKVLLREGAWEFDFSGTQPNLRMLKDQIQGKNNSWAIRWHAAAFIQQMYTLYPSRSMVKNIGFDNSGEHCVESDLFDVTLSETSISVSKIPIVASIEAYRAYVKFFKQARPSWFDRVIRKGKAFYTAFINPDPEAKVLLGYLRKYVYPRGSILDIGCGYGRYLKPLQKQGYQALGIDRNKKIVEKNQREKLHSITVEEFEKNPRTFDAIICSHIIEHLSPPDLIHFLNYYVDKLKKGGILIIATPLFSDGFYDDFDHIKPYQPASLQMVFSGQDPQIQYCTVHRLDLIDLWFRKRPFGTFFYRAKYIKSFKTPFFRLYDFLMVLLFKVSAGWIGKKDAWVGVYFKP